MRKIIKRFVTALLLLFLITGGFVVYKGYEGYKDALKVMSVEEMGEKIQSQEHYTSLDELPDIYIDAVLSVEDKRFYKHFGIDPIALGRALVHDIQAMSFVEGGSTITQQLAKNQFFTQDKNLFRKVSEMFMAFDIEKTYDKNTILELYLNSIYFGNGYYCVRDASYGYFGKPPADMTDDEATLLAGVPNAPSVYNPIDNPKLARERQQQVLRKMQNAGFLA